MPTDDELTSREVIRYLDENTAATRELRAAIDALRTEIAQTYVRKDVWLEARKNDAEAGLALAEKVNSLVSLRDWALKIVVGAVIVALLGLVLVSKGQLP